MNNNHKSPPQFSVPNPTLKNRDKVNLKRPKEKFSLQHRVFQKEHQGKFQSNLWGQAVLQETFLNI